MSELSFMEKLLDLSDRQVGGVEVEWKALGEVGEFIRGKRFVKTDMLSEGVPCIHYGEMYTHYGIWADKAKFLVPTVLGGNAYCTFIRLGMHSHAGAWERVSTTKTIVKRPN